MATRGAREPGGDSVASSPVAPAPAVHKAAKPAHKAQVHKAATPASKPAAKPAPVKPQLSATQRTAVKVTKALAKGDAVVFFFTRAGAADDTGTRQAVRAAQGPKVLVVRAGLKDLSAFRPVLSGAGVSQVPAVVVAHAGKPARLLEGYVDSGTLRQTIADALR
jgi:hypothetical protein